MATQHAVTVATVAASSELLEAAAHFLPLAQSSPLNSSSAPLSDTATQLVFEPCTGGYVNKVYYVTRVAQGGQKLSKHDCHEGRFVLRIYNNGFDAAKVAYEHAVLAATGKTDLPFAVPTPVPSDGNGRKFVELSSGAHACMFRCIEGSEPPLSAAAARSIGAATARVVAAMSGIKVELPCPNPQFRHLYQAHPAVTTKERFFAALQREEFSTASIKPHVDYIASQLRRMEEVTLPSLCAAGLPEQQIHADLHHGNTLTKTLWKKHRANGSGERAEEPSFVSKCNIESASSSEPVISGNNDCTAEAEGEQEDELVVVVTGVLDFEFTAVDWRVLEATVGLSKYLSLESPQQLIEAWLRGYAEGGGRLTSAEARCLPDLLVLRHLIGIVYFVGRTLSTPPEDTPVAAVSRFPVYAKRIQWIEAHRQWVSELAAALLVVEL